MSGFKRPSLLVPSAAAFGHIAVNAIGTTAKKIPYWAHALYVAAITSLPDSITFPQAVSKLKVCTRAHSCMPSVNLAFIGRMCSNHMTIH